MPTFRPLPLLFAACALVALSATAACSTATGTAGSPPADGGMTADVPRSGHGQDSGGGGMSADENGPGGMPDDGMPDDGMRGQGTIADGQSFALRPGASAALAGGGRLEYTGITADSRCKPGHQCIWEGDAEVAFRYTADGGDAESFSLHTSKRVGSASHTVDGHVLTLVSLAQGDAPEAQLRLDAAQ